MPRLSKADNALREQRIQQITGWILAGTWSRGQRESLASEWGLRSDTIEEYSRTAYAIVRALVSDEANHLRIELQMRVENLRVQAMAARDLRSALRACEIIARLFGLYMQ